MLSPLPLDPEFLADGQISGPRACHCPLITTKTNLDFSIALSITIMRTLFFLTYALLPIYAFAAQKRAESPFQKYLSRSLSYAPLKLDDASFTDLTGTPRDYTLVALLTAMPAQFGCQLCREFQPEFDIVARSWTSGDKKGNSKVLFGTLDFPDGKSTFQKVRRLLYFTGINDGISDQLVDVTSNCSGPVSISTNYRS